MDIHFISTLTPDDEDRLAVMIVEVAKGVLGTFPISYKLRVETTGHRLCEHEQIGPAGDALPESPLRGRPTPIPFLERAVRTPQKSDET